jgi:hypothetical protein
MKFISSGPQWIGSEGTPFSPYPRYGSIVLKEVTDLFLERNFFHYFREWKRGFRNMLSEELSLLLV